MQKIFNFYQDASHGWVKVPFSLIKELGIEKNISCHSYWRKGQVYLEEDCDFGKFCKALKEKKQFTITEQNINPFHTDRTSKIRSYEMYNKEIA